MRILRISRPAGHFSGLAGAGLLVLGLWFGAPAAQAQDLLTVNGAAITQEQVLAVNPAAQSNAQVREQVAEQLAQQQLLADTVKNVPASLEARIAAGEINMKRQALAQLAADQFLQAHPITEAQLKAQYDKIIAALPPKQFWLRWIVVKTPDEAKKVIDALRAGGESFTSLAIRESIGQNAQLGGALGWQTEQTLPVAILGVVRKLKPGQVAGPISFDSGYAIVQLAAERDTPKPSFEQLKPQIEEQLRNVALQQHVQDLAKTAKIDRLIHATAAAAHEQGKESEHAQK